MGLDSNNYTVDNTAPVVNVTNPTEGGYYKTANLPANPAYTVTEANPYNAVVTGYNTNNVEGNHTVTVTVTDAAGNVGLDSNNYTVDNTAPDINITSPADHTIYSTPQILLYTVSDNLDANPTVSGPANGTIYSTAGNHTVVINATDLAGNTNSESITFHITRFAELIGQLFLNSETTVILLPDEYHMNNYQFNGINIPGMAYFYHPLTNMDMSAFESIILSEDIYEFIDNYINIIGQDGLPSFFDEMLKRRPH